MSDALRVALLVLVAGGASAGIAAGAGPTALQKRCINTLDRTGAAVADARARAFAACVAAAAKGRLPAGQTARECFSAKGRSMVGRARARTAARAAAVCSVPPDFGPTSAAAVTAAFETMPHPEWVFGADLDAALVSAATDPTDAGCQASVARGMARVTHAKLRGFNACVRDGLRQGWLTSATGLLACFHADAHGSVQRAVTAARRATSRTCAQAAIATAFPGACSGTTADGLFACIEPRVDCAVCLGLNAGQGTSKFCHHYVAGVAAPYCGSRPDTGQSVARQWDEELLDAIRLDTSRPTVHARTLFHVAVAMWDAWAAYDPVARGYLTRESVASDDVEADRATAITFAAYRVLRARFANSPGAVASLARFDFRMEQLGADRGFTQTTGNGAPAVGNRVAAAVLAYAAADGSNEAGSYADPTYAPINPPLIIKLPGTTLADPNRWQPLALGVVIAQDGTPLPDGVQKYISAGWGRVRPFALVRQAPGRAYLDPGAPPRLGGATDDAYEQTFLATLRFGSEVDPDDGVMTDVSPAVHGNNPLGTDTGTGYGPNPVTGVPYDPNVVRRGDWSRVLVEFWAEGPNRETPPGHWNVIANAVSDHPLVQKGMGALEWDVKLYLALNGALHDAAVAAWDVKRTYDGVRPISAIRYMADHGQSTDSGGPAYDPQGLPLEPGLVEVITAATTAPGERHAELAGHEGEIAVRAWPGEPADPTREHTGTRWVLATTWVPYQRKSFVTPAFAGFVSEHSTFSRAAAEVLARFTGSPYFPGGLGEFVAPQDAFLQIERGPSKRVVLQWAAYADAADDAGLSRLWAGTHTPADDVAGRIMGSQIGAAAFDLAQQHFTGTAVPRVSVPDTQP